jgi:hypothetical protein
MDDLDNAKREFQDACEMLRAAAATLPRESETRNALIKFANDLVALPKDATFSRRQFAAMISAFKKIDDGDYEGALALFKESMEGEA